jgi:hypothetical protein
VLFRSARSPEEQWRTSLESVKTRLHNQILDLTKQINTGEKTPKKPGIKYDEEAMRLKAERDTLKAVIEGIEGRPEMSPEQRIRMATSAVEKSIAEYERRIKEHDLTPGKKESKTPLTTELRTLRERRDALKDLFEEMQKEARPKKSPEEIALKSYKTRTTNRLKELEKKLATKDYAKKPRKTLQLDPEAMRLRAEAERYKELIKQDIHQIRMANRTKLEKGLDYSVKWRRAVILSGITTIGKLTNAALWRTFIQQPSEDFIAGIYANLPGFSQVVAESPRFSAGFNVKAQAKAFRQFVEKQTYVDMKDVSFTGQGSLDRLYGKHQNIPPHMLDFFAHVHGALKVTPKRAEFFRSLEDRAAWYIKHGYDITEPTVQMAACSEAYIDSNRAILMNDNIITDTWKRVLGMIERTGPSGKVMAAGARILMPIVKVPTNYTIETADYAYGLPKGVAQTIYYLTRKEKLKDVGKETFDAISRSLSKGTIGLLMLALGYYYDENIGGYYQPGERRKSDVPAGGIRIFGHDVPHWFLHVPPLEVLQMGATIHRVQKHYAAKLKGNGTVAGILAAAVGLAERIPFMDQPARIAKAAKDTDSMAKFAADLGRSLVVPPDVSNIARWTDKDPKTGEPIKRKAEGAADVIKMGIPGLRQEVPRNEKLEKDILKDKLARALIAGEPDAQDKIREARQAGEITYKDKQAIEKATQNPVVLTAKQMSLEKLSKAIDNATEEEKKLIRPIFVKKFKNQAGKLTEGEKKRYMKVLNSIQE